MDKELISIDKVELFGISAVLYTAGQKAAK